MLGGKASACMSSNRGPEADPEPSPFAGRRTAALGVPECLVGVLLTAAQEAVPTLMSRRYLTLLTCSVVLTACGGTQLSTRASPTPSASVTTPIPLPTLASDVKEASKAPPGAVDIALGPRLASSRTRQGRGR
jgi:hypothetical protein